ncbi:CHASE2 domain-containing protein [Lusitaniella coriacea]|uniref:CHASE2 domain-containing protein n=1 Tax=Lusitaniella coriacea TaxID=1983105 RepID=UPI003CE990AA
MVNRSQLNEYLKKICGAAIVTPCVATLVIALQYLGIFQVLEWAVLDRFFRQRPQEPPDSRIVLITIDDDDLTELGQWPISDRGLADLIQKIQRDRPVVIGLDLYRDLPVEPGSEELVEVIKSTPNLIGVQKRVETQVKPHPTLAQLNRLALADLVLDGDGKIRRGLISVQTSLNSPVELSLGAKLALMYLRERGIEAEYIDPKRQHIILGKAKFSPLLQYDGSYVRVDNGGYQILLNFRGVQNDFQTVSLSDVLSDRVPEGTFRDRAILIGSVAISLKDMYPTPYSKSFSNERDLTPGVVVHANLTSQIVDAALGHRPLFQVLPDPLEWLYVLVWSGIGTGFYFLVIETKSLKKVSRKVVLSTGLIVLSLGTLGSGYLAFLASWWIPSITPLFALIGSAIASAVKRSQKLQRLASLDNLTQVANRGTFDKFLLQAWERNINLQQNLSLIFCDVDCFKLYNDNYGHQAGDRCLQQVAKAMCNSVRMTDLVARYGGEEFVVILPKAQIDQAVRIAERIQSNVQALQIPHTYTKAKSEYVTLSCGVASFNAKSDDLSPKELIERADRALYQAKEEGRDRAIAYTPKPPSD